MNKSLPPKSIGKTINRLCMVLSTLFIFWCPVSITAQVDFPGIDAFLKSTLKQEDKLDTEARGDLNGDALEDWAGVIRRQPADSSSTYQLYVLLGLRQGGYHVSEKSMYDEIPGTGCCWVESLEIRRSSIYIQYNAKGGDIMEATTHQFKLHKGEWRLVGMKIYLTDFSHDPPASTDTNMNLLTGLVIVKRQKGDNRPITKSRRKKFKSYLLKDFDFSGRFGNE